MEYAYRNGSFGEMMSDHEQRLLRELIEISKHNFEISKHSLRAQLASMGFLARIADELSSPTPTAISFQESTMLPPVAGNTLIFTGTLAPSGSQFPAGTTFSVSSSDPTVTPTIDETGLVVTIPLPATFVDDPANPLSVTYTASGITPEPSTSPTSLTATITPTIPIPPTATPVSISFAQTT